MVQLAKGVRDFAPNEKIARNYLVDTLKSIFETYGFNPLETPIIERFETLATKDSGAEILKEVFKFQDQGKRELALRFDLTVPLARFIALNPNIKLPFKRYQVGRVFRDGPIKLGRYREFWQCDVDIVGSNKMIADAEILTLVQDFFKKIGLEVTIIVNNIKLLNALIEKAGFSKTEAPEVILSLDKYKKIGPIFVKEELINKGLEEEKVNYLINELIYSEDNTKEIGAKENNKKTFNFYNNLLPNAEGLQELKKLFSLIDSSNIAFFPELARGLSYYTGTIFEVLLNSKNTKFKPSLAGGGRYDNMIGEYASNGKTYPAVGISFGLEPILEVMKLKEKLKIKETVTQLFIIQRGKIEKECFKIAKKLREKGVKVEIDLMQRKEQKNIKYVTSKKIPYILIVGEDEIVKGKFILKDMDLGKEYKDLTLNEINKKLNEKKNH